MSIGCGALITWSVSTGISRLVSKQSSLFAVLATISGCAMTPAIETDGSVNASDGLYSGEPVVLHATEIPVASAEEARNRARVAIAERDIDLALYLFVQAVNLEPEDAVSLYAIGVIHADRGNADLAARAFSRTVAVDPDHSLANQGLGIGLFEARKFEEAEEYLLKAIALDPTLWRASNTLGILADRNEEYDRAISHYTSAIEAQPNLPSMRNNRGYSRYLSGDLYAAKLDFLEALEIDPQYERAWRNLGLVLAREQDYDRALSAMEHAVPKHVALNDIGYVAMLDGNYGPAGAFFEEAIRKSPRHYQIAQDNLTELRGRRAPALLAEE